MWTTDRILRNGQLSWLTPAERRAQLCSISTVAPAAAATSTGGSRPVSSSSSGGSCLGGEQHGVPGMKHVRCSSVPGPSAAGAATRVADQSSSTAPRRHRHLAPQEVVEYWRRGGRLPAGAGASSSSGSDSDSDSDSGLEALASRLKFWRVD
jgi:hypothetical protein